MLLAHGHPPGAGGTGTGGNSRGGNGCSDSGCRDDAHSQPCMPGVNRVVVHACWRRRWRHGTDDRRLLTRLSTDFSAYVTPQRGSVKECRLDDGLVSMISMDSRHQGSQVEATIEPIAKLGHIALQVVRTLRYRAGNSADKRVRLACSCRMQYSSKGEHCVPLLVLGTICRVR